MNLRLVSVSVWVVGRLDRGMVGDGLSAAFVCDGVALGVHGVWVWVWVELWVWA